MNNETSRTQENQEGDYLPTETNMALIENSAYEAEFYPQHRDPAYRPWVIAAMPKKPTPYQEVLAIMGKNLKRAIIASRISLVFAFIILIDFTMPNSQSDVKVTGYNRSPAGTYQMELSDGSVINVTKKLMRTIKGDLLTVSRTKFFRVPTVIADAEKHAAKVVISIYGNFIFMPLTLLITSLVGAFYKKGVELRYNLGVASAVLVLLNIAFLFIHQF